MNKLPGQNIHTEWVANALGVTMDVALKVQDKINNDFHLDWSEATEKEIRDVSHAAFESLTIVI